MEPEPGVASFISLSEHEQRYYSGLRSLCQADTSGKLSSGKVAELFKASQLPPESLHKVTEVCGAKHLGYFGPPQFYVGLKLLAAAQSGLPIHLESLTANLPLPRFVGLKNDSEVRYSSSPAGGDGQGAACGTGSVSWTPADRSAFRQLEASTKKESRSPPQSPRTSSPRSPLTHRSFPCSQQRNGAEAQSAAYESKHSSHGIVQLEQQSSPSRYGPKPAAERASLARTCSSEKLDQQTVADYSDSDPWRITEEQLEYYTNQFKSLQPDLGALILGSIAKNFFTKSKLPIPELSHIWELSDVDRDGALTFSEFCTAFHLIVARKNGYPLPESLPLTLRPGFVQQDQEAPETPESLKPLIVFEDAELRPSQRERHISSSSGNDRTMERLQPNLKAAKQELKEEKCSQDVMKRLVTSEEKAGRPEPPHDLDLQMKMKSRPRSYSSTSFEDAVKKAEEPPTPPPRPQKSHSRASSLDLNKLFQQGAPGLKSGWLPPPPPPALPPRPSASQVSPFVNVAEKTPLKKVQQPNFADFSHFREEEESSVKPEKAGLRSRFGPSTEDLTSASKQDGVGVSHSQAPQKPVRRKYQPENQSVEAVPPPSTSFPTKTTQKLQPRQRREIQMAIRKNKETNAVLTRLNSELQQQLKVVHQERVTLESQLEILRPLASA